MRTPLTPRVLFALLLPVAVAAQSTVLLSDNFDDHDRSNQNLPESARWFGSHIDLIEVGPGNYALRNSPPSATRHMVAYFAPADSPVTLAAGESLTLSFDLTPTSDTPKSHTYEGFRIGVFHSGASRLTSDSNRSTMTPVGGYGLFTNPRTSRTAIRTRNSDAAVYITSMTTGWSPAWDTASPAAREQVVMDPNKTYNVKLVITRLRNGNLKLDYSLIDGRRTCAMTFTDSSGSAVYSFDTLAIAWHTNFGEGYIDNVLVSVKR